MEQKDWEERLDRYADRTAEAVKQGVHILEDAFDKGKATLQNETPDSTAGGEGGAARKKGSPRLGLVLVFLGIVWLLHSLGILEQPVFPILLIILGVYFIVRSK